MRLRRWLTLVGVLTLLGTLALSAQDTLSQQVLLLLSSNNTWTGVQTFGRAVGLALQRENTALPNPTDRLENRGGNLYFNGALVATTSGPGTVTSVGLSLPALFTVSNSPVTSSGTLTAVLATQTANRVWAGPTTGSAAAPTFRALVSADIPSISGGSITGQVGVPNGGTGLASGTSGGVLYFSASTTMASSAALTASRLVLGGGAGSAPTVLGSLGTTTTLLHGNAAGAPTFGAVSLTADVSGTLPVANGGTGLTAGTSGGILGYTASGTLASSVVLPANRLLLGGGAGATPTALGSLGTAATVLHGNTGGAPSFSAVVLNTDVSGTLQAPNGGTGFAVYAVGDLLYANDTISLARLATSASATRNLSNTGASNIPAWAQINLANGVTGTLPAANGGTSVTSVPTNGQTLIGNGSGYTLATLTGTANQVVVANGAGTITLSTPQSINTTSTPQFARLGLGTGAGGTALITLAGQVNYGIFDVGNCGAASTVNWNNGETQKTLLQSASCTLTFTNPITGALTYDLMLTQDGTGGRLIVWPTILWEGGAEPTLSVAPGAIDYCHFRFTGTAYLGWCELGMA